MQQMISAQYGIVTANTYILFHKEAAQQGLQMYGECHLTINPKNYIIYINKNYYEKNQVYCCCYVFSSKF